MQDCRGSPGHPNWKIKEGEVMVHQKGDKNQPEHGWRHQSRLDFRKEHFAFPSARIFPINNFDGTSTEARNFPCVTPAVILAIDGREEMRQP
ncbi:hypothetical protein E2C01_083137 [Portunus trituberculatus]|uniref:Uncharacterized protein n=1 Tax=Portunus trituberculatus TaxID=210409 RepID=A0A5B7J3P8_PORTR|nr:hypothetical protein [Portunus trituberculatus]